MKKYKAIKKKEVTVAWYESKVVEYWTVKERCLLFFWKLVLMNRTGFFGNEMKFNTEKQANTFIKNLEEAENDI